MPLARVANVVGGATRVVHVGARQLFLSTREVRNVSGVPTRVSPVTAAEHKEAQRRAAERMRELFEGLHRIAIAEEEAHADRHEGEHGDGVAPRLRGAAPPQFRCSRPDWWRRSRCVIAVGEDWRACETGWARPATIR